MSKTILVVDDSISLRKILNLTLTGAGYEVIEAEDGVAALALLDGRKIHLIVCDVNMPKMDGLTFAREMKKNNAYRFTPILMLTTETGEDKKEIGMEAGVRAWLTKPFQPPQLLAAISKLIL
jgi:two-component system, chemotaxis family, chemotaxis protein CheY